MPPLTSTAAIPSLMEALEFTDDDLVANRAGRLSAAQVERLKRLRSRALTVGIAVVVVIGLIATMFLFLGQYNASPILSIVGIGITVCNAVVAGVMLRNWLRLGADIRGEVVQTLTGKVKHTLRVAGRVPTYILTIDGQELQVGKPLFFAIRENERYCLYRAPASRVLLAAEPA